jgi:23S rRNA (cytosine1962-C5)-methyltransferase
MSDIASGRNPAAIKSRLRLRVTAAAESIIRAGHPWLFSESIREQNRAGEVGNLAVIYDRKDEFLAVGLYDPESPIRVRILHRGKPRAIDKTWWRTQLLLALERRRELFDENTTGYRCINGESEGWPGLVLDRYEQTYVVKVYTAAWLPHLASVLEVFREELRPERIVLRLSRNIQTTVGREFAHRDGEVLFGPPLAQPVVFRETGLRFEADVLRGQKTGFFLDQRENRRQIERLATNRRVLNAFSFSGGFSLYAARGGACSVTDLDISEHPLSSSRRNFLLNASDARVSGCKHEQVKADAFERLKHATEQMYDLIVLDPPSLAKRQSERAGAVGAYETLADSALGHLGDGGILVACSCSAHVSAAEFFEAVRSAARNSRRSFQEMFTRGHAPDHPATFAAAEYLKAIYLRF